MNLTFPIDRQRHNILTHLRLDDIYNESFSTLANYDTEKKFKKAWQVPEIIQYAAWTKKNWAVPLGD
jgi:hypothetical protein